MRRMARHGTNIFGEGVSILMRRDAAQAAGGFRHLRPYAIDLDLWVRLLEHGPLVAINRTLASFRVTEGAWSVELARQQAGQIRSLLREVRLDPDNGVRRIDFVLGWFRAGLNARLRRLAYGVVRYRSRQVK